MPVNTLFQVLKATATVLWLHGLFQHKCQRTSRLFFSLWEPWSWLILSNLRECRLCGQKGLKEPGQGGEVKILTSSLHKGSTLCNGLLRPVTWTREKTVKERQNKVWLPACYFCLMPKPKLADEDDGGWITHWGSVTPTCHRAVRSCSLRVYLWDCSCWWLSSQLILGL